MVKAISRQPTHYSCHVGQIIPLAKHYAGDRWQGLRIPRGRSADFDVSKKGGVYGMTIEG